MINIFYFDNFDVDNEKSFCFISLLFIELYEYFFLGYDYTE